MWCLRVYVCTDSSRTPDPLRWTPCVGHPALDTLRLTALRRSKFRFFSSPATNFFLFFSLLGLCSWNCGCDSRPRVDHQKCAFGLPEPFCKTLAACKPPGLATPSGLPPHPSFGPPLLRAPHPSGPYHDTPQNGQSGLAKNGLTQIGQIRIGLN